MHDIKQLKEQIQTLRERVKQCKILVVDDEDEIREKTGAFMERFFDIVHCAEDGKVALDMFNQDPTFDIVITDLQMPNMPGEKLIKALKIIEPELFIVIMTGTPPDVDDEYTHLYDLCLAKPVGVDDMLKMMEMLVERKKL